MRIRVEVEDPPTDAAREAVRAGLSEYNRTAHPATDRAHVQVIARDEQGAVCGGAIGSVQWGELYVDILWVADELRGQGVGSRLMQQIEDVAQHRGCHRVHLGTMGSQAPGFYPRIGYVEYARFAGTPKWPACLLYYKDIPLNAQNE